MTRVVIDNIELDDAPMERVQFTSGEGAASLLADLVDGHRIAIYFVGVRAFRFAPLFDRRFLSVDGHYRRTVVEIMDSPWIADLRSLHEKAQETLPSELHHYVVPSDDGVWEFLAKGIDWELS